MNSKSDVTASKDSLHCRVRDAARWEEDARALLKLALELAYEVRRGCRDTIHDEQIEQLKSIEAEWAGRGPNDLKVSEAPGL